MKISLSLTKIYDHVDGMTASAFVLFENTEFSRNAARHGLQVIGKNEIFKVNGKAVHDAKLRFKRCGEPDKTESPLARHEIELWERRKVWLGPKPFFSTLCCEHYLLYAEMAKTGYRPEKHKNRRIITLSMRTPFLTIRLEFSVFILVNQ